MANDKDYEVNYPCECISIATTKNKWLTVIDNHCVLLLQENVEKEQQGTSTPVTACRNFENDNVIYIAYSLSCQL